MKVKAGQLLAADQVLARLGRTQLPIVAALNVSLAIAELAPKIAEVEKQRVGVFERHGEEAPREDGQPGRAWTIKTPEAQKAARDELDALMGAEIEIVVEPIDAATLAGVSMTPEEIAPISWLLR